MSIVLEKHWERLLADIAACETGIREIETDLRIRAMSNDASDWELAFLKRLSTRIDIRAMLVAII
ncbi:hypothetical protein [Agrobacterium tumefaciens]|uniref:hypothetical protein n=1 Tax=Agrobacterium tumefaciens TaxID=358 RepID=UPI001E549824|nr:hypothetical protein [Agrobacterium tumefaciens]